MKVALILIVVTRDAMTVLPVELPAYELPIAQAVFGEDNVEDRGPTGNYTEVEPDEEGPRLQAKWGMDAVERGYGDNPKGKIAKAAKAAEFVEPTPAKAAKAAKAAETDPAA